MNGASTAISQDEFEIGQEVPRQFERQRGVGMNNRQADQLLGDLLAAEHPNVALPALLGLDRLQL